MTAEGGGVFPSASLAPGELPGLAGTPLGEDRLQGEAISATCRTPEGLRWGSVVGGAPPHWLDACIRLESVLSHLVLCLEVRSHL